MPVLQRTPSQLRADATSLPPPGMVALPKPTHGCGRGQRGRINPSETLPDLGFVRQPEKYTLQQPVHPDRDPVYMH